MSDLRKALEELAETYLSWSNSLLLETDFGKGRRDAFGQAAADLRALLAAHQEPQPVAREALRGRLDQLWGWAKSGKTRTDSDGGQYYLMDVENVDKFTDAVLVLMIRSES